ncbi:hypothetical protein DM860_010490 [Cuscuta australis]|uniref:rRNA biogenesis protein RRP5 n=1 Tax=Cuscuta australis TaxID=267555 RepID=A0A328E1C0_9ASTE|nr:hypothetical protein DM860_010490 [Cuscuta australis]
MAPHSKKSHSMKPSKPLNLQERSRGTFKSKGKSNKVEKNEFSGKSEHPQFEDEDPEFPRGGASLLTRKEMDEVREEADAEFEHEERLLKKKKKQHNFQKKNLSAEEDVGSLFGYSISGKLPKSANRITWKNISPGMKLWAVIAEINEKDIVVSLPGGLRGLVRASETHDPLYDTGENELETETDHLSSLFHVGQLVSCVVLHLDDDKKDAGKHKIWLSLRLGLLHKNLTLDAVQEGMVLSAYIKSTEDHGYLLHFGLSTFSGFMHINSSSETKEIKVNTGQIVEGVVKSIDTTRKVVYLSSSHDPIVKNVTKDLKGISIDLLLPGMMVSASVLSVLENGIMLSFLTYFTGTVDMFNLQKTLPPPNWKDDYPQNKKVNARILFIDPLTRAVGLSLNPHLVNKKAPPTLVKAGDIFEQAKVIRIDKKLGLLLELPSSPVPTPAYVYVSEVDGKEVKKLEKTFKEGKTVRLRVLGFRHLEGLATGSLKTSAFEGSIFTHSDVKPGMVVKAKVITVDSFGAIVQFASGVKALCPLRHMSEFEIVKPRKKFQVGSELVFRVLGCKSKRITVTHKKTLVKSKHKILSSFSDATEGLITHGWITKIEKHGCFVRFYNGVQGFAPRFELGLDPGCDISSMYHVEQVVKCRVVSSNPSLKRINLSFTTTPMRLSENEMVKLGSVVSGAVELVTPDAIVVIINNAQMGLKGTIHPEHLSDHRGLAGLMKSVLKPGFEFDQLLVLDIEGCNLVLSAKYSLISTAAQLPLDVSHVSPHSVVHGYICNIIESGVFVRFLGRLTGFCPRSKATDDRRFEASETFYVGQSVRTNILDANGESGRITVSLKQSLCSSTDATFIQEYFLSEHKIAELPSLGSDTGLSWTDEFALGSIVEGKVHEIKEFGVVITFDKYDDVFGFISEYQLGGVKVDLGSTIQAAVIDVSKTERLLDLSLKPEFVNVSKPQASNEKIRRKKRKVEDKQDLEVNQSVNAVVEIVKENYVVLSIPACNNALGYASSNDFNTQNLSLTQFVTGKSVNATIMSLPDPSTSGRLLLLLKAMGNVSASSSSKRGKKNSSYDVGSLVQAEITDIKPFELRVNFGSRFHGRVHITEVTEDNAAEDPLSHFRIGQTLDARIISKGSRSETKTSSVWELSTKPSVLAGPRDINTPHDDFNYSTGQLISGFVYKVDSEWVWLSISRDVRAQIYILDSSAEPSELKEFQKRFFIGKAVSGYVLRVNKEKRLLRLVLQPLLVTPEEVNTAESERCHIRKGSFLGGRISKIFPGVGGLLIQIGVHLFGKVHFTELCDLWVSDPVFSYSEGQFVKCKALEVGLSANGTIHIDLSLRWNSDATNNQDISVQDNVPSRMGSVLDIKDLHPDMTVQGYVKNVTPKGCFIMLTRKVDARVLVSNLSDGFIENPEKEFPVGKLVTGKVVSVEPLSGRVEVTLKTSRSVASQKSDIDAFSNITVGTIILGRIKRVEPYGLFISIDHSNLVGLCHVSELCDERVDNIQTRYNAGDTVRAKILKVDKEMHRIALGMKNSYFRDEDSESIQTTSRDITNSTSKGDATFISTNSPVLLENGSARFCNFEVSAVDVTGHILTEVESRASIPPLEVPLNDIENSDTEDAVNKDPDQTSGANIIDGKEKKRAMKKAKKERELEIRAAEGRLLEKDIPRNTDEFEKLVRSSPNSSFVWIKYMAFMLSMSDVEKARSIAERALSTINIREESEKLNVWVAYFNLEMEYGNPPQEAVAKVFKTALQYVDPKKLHLALLGVYERSEHHNLADELLEVMVKKFKHSCKVWLRYVQWLLKQNRDNIQTIVNRALLCLSKHKHIKLITQIAILEFKCGVADRGRSMFEGMLREYPKRTDLWSVYLDQEIRLGDTDVTRSLFERAISLSLPPKKMKFLFKKYLAYEKSLGDEDRIEYVKQKATEYADTLS